MPKKPKITQEDLDALQNAMKGVKPLTQRKIRLRSSIKKPLNIPREDEAWFQFNENNNLDAVVSEEFIAFKQSGVSNKTLRKLRKGQYNVEATLDLHGLSVEEARKTVYEFLHQCLADKRRVVLIIHGKGRHSQKPILKNKLNHWLREVNVVLAFCSASVSHGSRGAIYILLKRTDLGEKFE